MRTFFVFDVESVGLFGAPFAVGWVLIREDGTFIRDGLMNTYHPDSPEADLWLDLSVDREAVAWVRNNVPEMDLTHHSVKHMLHDFGGVMQVAKIEFEGIVFAADCPFPVETNFLAKVPGIREFSPYPLIDVASVLMTVGMDPLKTYPRDPIEEPKHNPLNDARQSARLILYALNSIRKPIKDLVLWTGQIPPAQQEAIAELSLVLPKWDTPNRMAYQ